MIKYFRTRPDRPFFEKILTGFVIAIFALSAFQSALLIFEEITEDYTRYTGDDSAQNVRRTAHEFIKTYDAYLSGHPGLSNKMVEGELALLLHKANNMLAESVEDPAQKAQASALLNGAAEGIIKSLHDDNSHSEAANLRHALTGAMLEAEAMAAVHMARDRKAHLHEEHLFLLSSIITMAIAGAGLFTLFMLKLKAFEKVLRDKKKIAELLIPRMAAMEAATDGIMITAPGGEITYANMAMAHLHGYGGAENLVGKCWDYLFASSSVTLLKDVAFAALTLQWHWKGRTSGRRCDGSEYHQDIAITALEDGGKVWVIRDHSEAINTMLLAEKRLAAIEAAGDGIGMVDADGNLIYMNRALMALHGIPESKAANFIGKPWGDLYSDRGRAQIEQGVMPVLASKGYWKGEAPIRRHDGRVVHAEMSLTRLEDGGFISTARDIQERITAEQEKQELQKQFYQAQKMEAIGRLAGGVAHDFNNILASMMGYAEFLLEDLPASGREHKFAGQIMQGCVQAQALVEQILTFSRRGDTVMENVDFVGLLDESLQMLRATIPSTIAIEYRSEIPDVTVLANAPQISQTLMNLFVNAADAIGDTPGRISVTLTQDDGENLLPADFIADPHAAKEGADGFIAPVILPQPQGGHMLVLGKLRPGHRYIRVMVGDTGCGMTRAVMEQIFEPFYTTKPVDQGTGLGLSSVHGIMAGHGGAITVFSQSGQGTEFCIYFPLAEPSAYEARHMESFDTHAPTNGSGAILLVEDEEDVRHMLAQMLARMGYDSYACADGDEAVDHLRENPDKYRLILSDYTMPHMSGADLAREIRLDFPALPVIILSGYSRRRLKTIAGENPNIRAVLRKPVRRDILAREIASVMAADQSRQ